MVRDMDERLVVNYVVKMLLYLASDKEMCGAVLCFCN